MKTGILSITFILILATASSGQQTLYETIYHDGLTREYIVYIPAVYDGSIAVPLLFNFHGWTMTAEEQMTWVADMRPIADTANFILVYPQGSLFQGNTHWNVGGWTSGSTADDVGFTEAMIDTLSANYNIDPDRIYSCGYSNGGFFSFELSCQLSNKIAAIGEVAGSMTDDTYNACNATHPTPVLTIHGTDDGVVNYQGYYPPFILSQDEVISHWVDYNNTSTTAIITDLPDIDPTDGSTVQLIRYENGDNCVAVEHYKVIGGGHDWPGNFGNMDINANSVIWKFVSKYDINGLIGCNPNSIQEALAGETIKVFPNPSPGIFTVEMDLSQGRAYQVLTSVGEIVLTDVINHNNRTIDLSALPSGIYFLKINNSIFKLVTTP